MEENKLDINSLKVKADLTIEDLIAIEDLKDVKSLRQQMSVMANLFEVPFEQLVKLSRTQIGTLVTKLTDGIKDISPNEV